MNIILDTPTHRIETAGSIANDTRTSFNISNIDIDVDGQPANLSLTGDYVADIGSLISISATIENGEEISYPGVILKMPVIRYADAKPTDDEIYWNTSIVDGVMTATGTYPRSGDWKFVSDRINQALLRANAPWKINMSTISVLV